MELRRILAVALGLALIFLSVAPYIKARELTMQTPFGWEVLGSKRLRVPTKELQEIYSPDGTPTGRYGRPIDHDWFGEGKLIEIGGTHIWVLDTYQDERGCHVKVRVENLGGELTLAGGQSQGVQWGDLRLYITWAKFPPEEGDWRTAKGEYFYGFEEFELTLYRVPTAPAIPLSAAGAVLGVGLVLFGVAVIREGERRGILPILIGSAFLCALVIRFPGYETVQPVSTYARINWLGGLAMASDKDFRTFAVLGKDNIALYDRDGNLLWLRATPASTKYFNWIVMSDDGKWILVSMSSPGEFWLYDNYGTLRLRMSCFEGHGWLSRNGKRIAVWETENIITVIDTSGNVIRRFDFSNTYIMTPYPSLNDDGSRLGFYFRSSTGWGVAVYSVDTGSEIFSTTTNLVTIYAALSRTGRYLICTQRTDTVYYRLLYDVDRKILLRKIENSLTYTLLPGQCLMFTPDDSRMVFDENVGGSWYVRTLKLPENTIIDSFVIPVSYPSAVHYVTIKPTGDGWFIAHGGRLISNLWKEILTIKSDAYTHIISSDNEIYLSNAFVCTTEEVFTAKIKYKLSISAALPCISVDGAPVASSYSASEDPAQRRVVDLVPYGDYVVAGAWGNFTDMDNVKLAENRLEIYMDNDKSILVGLLGRPGTPAVSPAKPRPSENIEVTWTEATYYIGTAAGQVSGYELQVDNDEGFPHPVTYTAISGTSFTLKPPPSGWVGKYWVRVRAYVVGSTVYGNWSDPAYFEVQMPSPSWLRVTPSRPMYDQNVTLEWEPVALADYYKVKLRLGASENIVVPYTTQTTCVLSPSPYWVAPARYYVGVSAVSYTYGESAWVENYFDTQPVVGPPGPPPPPPPPAPGKLQLAAMVPMLPHPLVSAFNTLGQVAGVYTLSLLMVLGGLGLITVGLRRVP